MDFKPFEYPTHWTPEMVVESFDNDTFITLTGVTSSHSTELADDIMYVEGGNIISRGGGKYGVESFTATGFTYELDGVTVSGRFRGPIEVYARYDNDLDEWFEENVMSEIKDVVGAVRLPVVKG